VIEVKANLAFGEVDSIFQNVQSVKSLKKAAYQSENGIIARTVNMYGQDWSIWPVHYYVFAFEGTDLIRTAERFGQLATESGSPASSRVDMVCVLDRGVICNRVSEGSYDALPTPSSDLWVCHTEKSLLLFYTLASRYFNQTWLPAFRFNDYLGNMAFD
jgi:hypothetical protein